MLNIVKLFYTYACILIRIKTICVHKPHEDLRPILLKQITSEVCVVLRVATEWWAWITAHPRLKLHRNFAPSAQIVCCLKRKRKIRFSGSIWRKHYSSLCIRGAFFHETYIKGSSVYAKMSDSKKGEEICSRNWSRENCWRFIHGTSNVNNCCCAVLKHALAMLKTTVYHWPPNY